MENIDKQLEDFKVRYNNYKNAKTQEEREKNKIYASDFEILLKKIALLEEDNSKRTLHVKKREITDVQVNEIKRLRDQGLTYREIEQTTSWSKFTISKVLNGHYDK